MRQITAKLGNMKKAQEFIVYPGASDESIIIQSDRRICQFDPTTGKGMLSNGKGHPGFANLMPFLGAVEVTVPQDVIDAAIAAQPKSGDKINGVITIA